MRFSDDELLAELGWLRRLARGLVGPGGAEDDLVQEAWLAAQRVQGGVSRPWLVRTLRNLAASWHRGENRLRHRERAVAQADVVEPEALLERSETLSTVLQELRNLDEPFRTALLLLYQEGLSMKESAARLSIPADTLRWRHREGLARLRSRLDAQRRDWRAALLPLFPIPSTHVIRGTLAASGGAGNAKLLGGIVISLKTATAAMALAAVALFVLLGELRGPSIPIAPMPEPSADGPPMIAVSVQVAEEESSHRPIEVAASAPGPVEEAGAAEGSDVHSVAIEVRDERGRRVKGARVWLGTSPDPGAVFWTTDNRGVAEINLLASLSSEEVERVQSRLGRTFAVRAMTASRYGRTVVHSRDSGGEGVVRITPDADLTVQVLDAEGLPQQGVPVTKLRHRPGSLIFDRDTLARTNAQGMAVLRHILDPLYFDKGQDEFQVGPMVLLASRADATLSRRVVPADPVVLTLPPTVELRIDVRDARGELALAADKLRLVPDQAPESDRDSDELAGLAARSPLGMVEIPVVDGMARVAHMGLGLALLGHAPEADPMDSTFGFCDPLFKQGADHRLSLTPLEQARTFTGIALDDSGTPLGNKVVHGKTFLYRGRAFEHEEFDFRTDSTGRFSFPVSKALCRKWAAMEHRELELWSEGPTSQVRHAIELELPEGFLRGEEELGVLAFRTDRPWLAGRAVDVKGESVPLESVRLVVQTPQGKKPFRAIRNVTTLLARDQFAFIGSPVQVNSAAGETLELWCYSRRRPDAFLPVTTGQLDVLVEFPPAGELQGQLTTAAGDSTESYYLRFVTGRQSEVRNRPDSFWLADNGRFELYGLPAVPGQLEIRTNGHDRLIMTVPGILPGSDSEEQRQRLASLALNAPLAKFKLRVVDASGDRIRGAVLRLDGRSDDEPAGTGLFSIHLAEPTLVGTLRAPGYQSLELTLPPGEHTVALEGGPKVFLRPSSTMDLPSGVILQVQLARLEGVHTMEKHPLTSVHGLGFEGTVSVAGKYLVTGQLFSDGLSLGELPFSKDPLSVIEVAGDQVGQEFAVPFDQSAFEALIPPE